MNTYTKDRHFDNTKIKTVLGYQPIHEIEQGLTDTAHWYQEHGLIKGG